jgi:hypothetical protein
MCCQRLNNVYLNIQVELILVSSPLVENQSLTSMVNTDCSAPMIAAAGRRVIYIQALSSASDSAFPRVTRGSIMCVNWGSESSECEVNGLLIMILGL